jgi:hypothetical protein
MRYSVVMIVSAASRAAGDKLGVALAGEPRILPYPFTPMPNPRQAISACASRRGQN